ncbi:uncharacterized protein LOC124422541 [Vespa crabro]|uniref:uncharacterized protein LOC124422541 n=1 Tax=Vespa crabro TaxID=7445 RepID=UPI001F011E84|nr:uncharacterized protein LOC124422541 [Vespa crabro]XP_046815053.1 uncharacterized protein LOC124422541 [Vespa crabro]XP_046815054.1 uncharacterized protein LOC124422541 [Vespa crabro]XP_046815055.1 uncharacterized protein LOC124422541 [Vespa crabro]XP_046815056.1 uncharacterized protein LOC124422541 [Vespa crabro]XP_046815058.1 uncharacterized protein LOC124422541 [Vespa crabro]
MDNIFSLNNIYLRCYFLLTCFATTYAAPGVLGSFAGSSSAAFSSASASAHAGSVASAISSANAFTGGAFPSKNPDGTYGLTHQQGISAGSGSYIELGNINPDSNKFGLSHQVSGTKGSYNNKSQIPCSGCPNNKEKWELDNYDDQSEEKEEEWQEAEQDDCDDGQYRLEHHYHHHKSGVDKKQEEQTMSSIHKIENTNQYNYNQANNKGGYTTSSTKGQGNLNDRTYNNYGNLGYVGANNQNLNNNYDAYQHNTGALKDSLHPSSSWTDINKKKDENENKNSGIPGVLTSTSTTDNKYGNTNKDTVGGITSSQPNVGNKQHSYDQQNTGQWKNHANKDNSPSGVVGNVSVGSGCTPGVSSAACSTEPSTLQKNIPIPTKIYGTVGNGPGNVHVGNKPHSYDQQNTGQWKDHADKDNSPSGVVGDVGVGSGCTPGVSSAGCSSVPSTLQKNTPIPTQIYGTVSSGPANVHVGNKPHSYDQQNTGQWKDHADKDNSPSGVVGNVGVGSGCTPGVSSAGCSSVPSTLQKNTPIPTQIYGTVSSAPGNVHIGNKPHSYDQQNTGQWKDHADKDNSPSGVVGNVGVGSGCTPGVSSAACSTKPSTLQKNTPIPTQIYGTVGSGPGNVHVGNKPHSYDQQNTGQWKGHANKDNSLSGVVSNVGVGSDCTPGVSSAGCSSVPSTLQKNTPIPTQIYGTAGSGPANVHVGNKPHSYDQQNTGQWKDHANKDNSPSGVVINVGVESGCTPGVSFAACSSVPSTLQKNTPIPTQIHGTVGSGPGNVHIGNKPHLYDQQNTRQWKDYANKDNSPSGIAGNVGVGSGCTPGVSSAACSTEPSTLQKNTPIPTQIYGTVGSRPDNVHVGNKPHSYDHQNTGQWKDHADKDNSPSVVVGNVGVESGCTPGVSSAACSSVPSTLQKNTPIPTQIYGTVSSAPGNVHIGNKPHSYDQQNTGQWKDHADKDNSPSGVVGNVGVESGCTPGVSSAACSSVPSTLQKNTPIPTQIYGTVGSGPGNVHVGNKPHSYDQQNTGQWKDHANKDNSLSGVVSNVGVGSDCTPGVSSAGCSSVPSTLQKNTPIPTQIYGTAGSGPANVHVGNKPHSYDQQNTGQWKDHANKDNSPSGVVSNVGVESGCTPGVSSAACSSVPSTLQKNTPIPTQIYGTVGSGPGNVHIGNKPHLYDQQNTRQWKDYANNDNSPSGIAGNVGVGSGCTPGISLSSCSSEIPTVQKNVPTFSQTFGTTGSGASYQNNKNTNQPSGSRNCGTSGSSTCIGSAGYPIGSSQTTVGAIGNGHNVHGQSGSGDKNSYKWNGTNPFLHGGQGNLKPVIHTTSSPIFITNSLDAFDTTSKPIGFGNPFLDGTISNTFGTQHDKHNVEVTPIKSDALDKPIGVGNPFLTNGNGGSKSSTPIYSGASIGSVSSISILPLVTTTIKPIGQNNPFLEVSGGNVVNKYPLGVHPNVAENNKNVFSGSGTSEDKDSIHFSKSGVGITSPGTYSNTNRGVKSSNQHNKFFGNVATSNAGSSSTGNIDTDKSTGLNIPSAYNSNNTGHGVSSLTGTAGNNKPSYTLSTSPGFYDYKNMSPQTSGNGGATNDNRNSPSNSLINENNANGQFNPQITNAGAQSFAGAHAGSFASSFSSSQASSSSSSFASSKSGSYTANGDPNILHQLNGNWPFDIARSVSGASSWPSLNAGSHASAFASSSVGGWPGSEPISVKS